MARLISKKDPFLGLSKQYEEIEIVSNSSSVRYLPVGTTIDITYYPLDFKFSMKDLRWFKVVENEAWEWMEAHDIGPVEKTRIVGRNNELLNAINGIFKGVFYADVVGAYWATAYMIGIISKETYEALKDEKFLRNACLGSLGKKEHIWLWRKGEGHKYIDRTEKETEKLWWLISRQVGKRMEMVLSEIFFYWVDCVYAPSPSIIRTLADIFEGYAFTKKDCGTLIYDPHYEKATCVFSRDHRKEYLFRREYDFHDMT